MSDELLLVLRNLGIFRERYLDDKPAKLSGVVFILVSTFFFGRLGKGILMIGSPIFFCTLAFLVGLIYVVAAYIFGQGRLSHLRSQFREMVADIEIRRVMLEVKGVSERQEIGAYLDWRIEKFARPTDDFLRYRIIKSGFDVAVNELPTDRQLEIILRARELSKEFKNRSIPLGENGFKQFLAVIVLSGVITSIGFFVGKAVMKDGVGIVAMLTSMGFVSILMAINFLRERKVRVEMKNQVEQFVHGLSVLEVEFAQAFSTEFLLTQYLSAEQLKSCGLRLRK